MKTGKEKARLAQLLDAERALEQKEDALKERYRSGELSLKAYLAQKAELETQEDAIELALDALEDKLDAQYEYEHDDDRDDDYDDEHDDEHDDD